MTLLGRIGQFVFFVSLIALVVFFATVMADDPYFLYCFFGLIGVTLGSLMMVRGREKAPSSQRFRIIRSAKDKFEDRPEDEDRGQG